MTDKLKFSSTEIGKKVKFFTLSGVNSKKILRHTLPLMTEKDWVDLIVNIDYCYNYFAQRLKKEYPQMSEEDIRLCCLLRIKKSISDIALLLGINPDSVVKRKSRLKLDKLKLQNNVDFDEFLADF